MGCTKYFSGDTRQHFRGWHKNLPKGNLSLDFKCSEIHSALTTEKLTTKFSSTNFQNMLSPSYIILRIQRLEGKQFRSR